MLSLSLFILYTEDIFIQVKELVGLNINGRINNFRNADDTELQDLVAQGVGNARNVDYI